MELTVSESTPRTQMEQLESRVAALESRLAESLSRGTLVVPITTFGASPIEIVKEIKAVVEQQEEDEYVATFFDGQASAAGCNPQEAIKNLKDVMLGRFDYLDGLPADKLGPGPRRQIAVLREFMRRRRQIMARICS